MHTWILLNELVDVDSGPGAAGVKHHPVENPRGGKGLVRGGVLRLERVEGLWGRVHHLGHRVERLGDLVDHGGGRVEDLGHAGLRDFGRAVGDVRQEVVGVGRGLPVAVGDVAVVSVVGRLGAKAPGQEPQSEDDDCHCVRSLERRRRRRDAGG